ncbi:MAG TPA: GNAT family N-acetyltransferase [Phenylobacterium sp.]|jgi:ribosomal protein S18 acetylase RimI-like enzyme|uniref:GNAT family N-acetyltransferase n=1 Tax=Phenylobacterium sp. TaxID=1871053 RepID=UPI002D33C3DD|nr:GNAT family N-acetyltransferase [Phenylobacterium sp.]HZZ68724.1 GNAT family N-acetyltransferase [Phenylobacterium sp.]
MDVRFLGPGDEDLLIAAVDLTDEGPLARSRASAHLADADLVNLVAVEAGEVVGFIYGHVLRRFEATSFFIYSVDVAERHRRRGIAKAMIAALSAETEKGRWDEMFVLTNRSNAAAMALYASAGGIAPPPDDVVMFDFD